MQLAETRNIVRTVNKPVRQSQLLEALNAAVSKGGTGKARSTSGEPSGASSGIRAADVAIVSGPDTEGADADGARVLLVEDNPINQEVAAYYLKSFGCRVDIASDGLEALTATNSNDYDLIFMDCQMPNMDGFTATKRIRQREGRKDLAHTPIVALTASAFAGDREQCLAAGMDDHVSKPFVPEDLRATMDKWLQISARRVPASDGDGPAPSLDAMGDHEADGREALGDDNADVRPQPLDRQQLQAMQARSAGLLSRLIGLYREHAPPMIDKLHTAAEDGDCATIKSTAHALKSSSSNIAATNLAELCQLLEVHAQTNSIEAARKVIAEITTEFGRVSEALDREERETAEIS
jgi:CheY-like chemotaxis protein